MDYNQIRNANKRKKGTNIKLLSVIVAAAVLVILAVIALITLHYLNKDNTPAPTPAPTNITRATAQPAAEETPVPTSAPAPEPTPEPLPQRRGTSQPIPEDVREMMAGVSMPSGASVSYDELAYLTIPHYDFSYNVTEGHMVVSASVAEEVLDIFAELYDIQYPIERMELVDNYGGSDYDSIEHNNTSSFNYRESTDGSGRLSNHALGLAIDINPQINPYVSGDGTGSHANAREYWSRDTDTWSSSIAKAAYIGPDAEIYDIFVNEHGWTWGGSWSSYRDYQHFEKSR